MFLYFYVFLYLSSFRVCCEMVVFRVMDCLPRMLYTGHRVV